jgi:hypothetical protein
MIHAPKLGIDLQRDVGEILILSSFIECLIQLHAHRRYTKLDVSNALTKVKTVKCSLLQMNHLQARINKVIAMIMFQQDKYKIGLWPTLFP